MKITSLITTAIFLTGCVSATDKAYVDNLDCEAMAKFARVNVTSSSAIADSWEREDNARRNRLSQSERIFDQPSSDQRDSYMRKQYAKRCR